MGAGIGEAMAAVKAQGIGPAGPWFAHHLKMTPETFDFDICVPVSAPVTAVGRVKSWGASCDQGGAHCLSRPLRGARRRVA